MGPGARLLKPSLCRSDLHSTHTHIHHNYYPPPFSSKLLPSISSQFLTFRLPTTKGRRRKGEIYWCWAPVRVSSADERERGFGVWVKFPRSREGWDVRGGGRREI